MVIFVGVARKDLKDPHHPPAGAEGPFVISGQNRFVTWYCSLLAKVLYLQRDCRPQAASKPRPLPFLPIVVRW